ncbi:uncharacterized protein DAT39_010751, partial [Clarias magur]
MWFLVVIFLLLLPCDAIDVSDECVPSVSMSHNGYVNVMSSQSFNLTCTCTCFSANYTIQLLKNKQVLSELGLSRHTMILFLLIPAVQRNDSGRYECRSKPTKVSSSVNVSVVYKDKDNVDETDNITAPVVSGPTTGDLQSTCNPSCS